MIGELSARIIELQDWGWNWVTVSFVATILFDIAEALAVFFQMRTIRRERRAGSVSVKWFCYFGCLLIVLGCYGFRDDAGRISLAMLGEGFLGAGFYVPMMFLLWRIKGYSRMDKLVLAASLAMIPAVLFLPWKAGWVTIFSGGAILALATMPWEVFRNRSRGQVELGLTLVYLANVSFWMIYGFAAGITPLKIVTPIGVVLLLVTLGLWISYPTSAPRRPAASLPR